MIPVVIASSTPFCGKTMITLGLALNLKDQGYKIGYIKTIGRSPIKKGHDVVDQDAEFIKETLGLDEPREVISPFILGYETQNAIIEGELNDVSDRILGAVEYLRDKDIVIIGGGASMFEGSLLNINVLSLMEKMDGRLLMIEPWRGMLSMDALYSVKNLLGAKFAGGIINKIPDNLFHYIKESVVPFMAKRGVRILGAIPVDKVLESITVRHITEVLNGGVLCCEDRLDEIVENFLIGAMDVESAMGYFMRTHNKAVITGAHRSDIQLAALETSTKCIILTGGLHPNDVIVGKAVSKGVPIISVADDTFKVVEKIEKVMGCALIREKSKIERAKEVLRAAFDMDAFLKSIK